jgi:hypothetical protein
MDERGLAGADVTREKFESRIVHETEIQTGDGILMLAAQIKKIGVGCDVKRLFLETEIFFVHKRSVEGASFRSLWYCRSKTGQQRAHRIF